MKMFSIFFLSKTLMNCLSMGLYRFISFQGLKFNDNQLSLFTKFQFGELGHSYMSSLSFKHIFIPYTFIQLFS